MEIARFTVGNFVIASTVLPVQRSAMRPLAALQAQKSRAKSLPLVAQLQPPVPFLYAHDARRRSSKEKFSFLAGSDSTESETDADWHPIACAEYE